MTERPSAPAPPPTDEERQRLAQLAALLRQLGGSVRHVDYRQAERDAEQLAAQLVAHCGRRQLARSTFCAIPRGGLFVLGLLAYLLDLKVGQLTTFTAAAGLPAPGPLVLVDDCALTGARLGEALAGGDATTVVVAHLYSHPALRRAVVEREPQVEACLAAGDLEDLTPLALGGDEQQEAWRRRWHRRLGGERYWLGQPQLVSFSWSEPDRPFWNPVTGTVEDGWRFLTPHRCLKNRAWLGLEPRGGPPPRWRLAEAVAVGRFDDTLWLCHTGSEEVFSLDPVAARMLRTLLEGGEAEEARTVLADELGGEPAVVASDLDTFTLRLTAAGLLEPHRAP